MADDGDVIHRSRPWQLDRLRRRHGERPVTIAYLAINCAVAAAILGIIAGATHLPFIFPSLGPSAFILFYAPLDAQASPRNVICGQLIAVISGYLALLVFGLTNVAPDLEDVSWARVGAVALALALTAGGMYGLGVVHAPAAATTLIIALGVVHQPIDLVILMMAMVVLVVEAFTVNRLAGIPVPLWSPRPAAPDHPTG